LVIDSTGLKVFGEGEWKVRKHGKERRRIWRKLHLAVDSNTHESRRCSNPPKNLESGSDDAFLPVGFYSLKRYTCRAMCAGGRDE
ncbi:transposase, partial [Salmonella enterica subsp. enterica serovar Kentucky]|nr:transposase [Salmonella enterica subsp. enterica serovar Kentucky]